MDYDISWFGSRMPGNENELIEVYQNAPNEEIKSKALDGMFKFKKISQPSINFLKSVADQDQKERIKAIRLICKTSVDAGRNYLLELLHSNRNEDLLQALMIVNSYSKTVDSSDFIKVIVQSLDRVNDPETLRYAGYVLEYSGTITIQNFSRFLCQLIRVYNQLQFMPHAIAMTN